MTNSKTAPAGAPVGAKATTKATGRGAAAAKPKAAPKTAAKAATRAKAPAAPKRAPSRAADEAAAPAAKPKHKLIRDSFTIPKSEYGVLEALKQRAANLKRPTKKSEVLRAGIAALNAMSDAAFLAVLDQVPSLKTGRPKAGA